ncbi:unnamed protein product [Dracunculus medinensis]|uniref:Acyl-CoA_dh_1 domain-containing protein n=1 Tax=Dracunculus medinensis TaxID=318479 RepID=A0A0N4UQB5_DRAME|nr:unnamed protein product [Dracunculus medinensis]
MTIATPLFEAYLFLIKPLPLASTEDQDVLRCVSDSAGVILYAAEKATQVCLDAIQILGGNGYVNDYPTGRFLRDAKLYEIGAGTSEIRRILIAKALSKEWS